ncbi:hypothetical protein LMIY3S_03546 [Labrys miyagiensis]
MTMHPFRGAVLFSRGTGVASHVGNTEAALYFLEHKWPGVEGAEHGQACRVCKRALAGDATTQEAREAFVRALEEAQFDLLDVDSTTSGAVHWRH